MKRIRKLKSDRDPLQTRSLRRFVRSRRRSFAVGIASLGVIAAFFVQLIIANSLATRGGEINDLEKRKLELSYEISLMEEENSRLSSFARIRGEALSKLGMIYEQTSFEYLRNVDLAYLE